ncbi:MAG: hypothetical protein LBN00_12200, partial [Oscillospiraceae bacterium]|nr:hypothetical protein [Oscillospiraceae bacterium]
MNEKIFLRIPSIDEMDYRRRLWADPETTSFNAPYGDDGVSGVLNISEERLREMYTARIASGEMYYAYIIDAATDEPVGEVNIHFDFEYQEQLIGITIEARHRG